MKRQKKYMCSCMERYASEKYGKCLRCHVQGLRKYAKDIERLKNDVGNCLSAINKSKWDSMNSQLKKLAVFKAMDLGFIEWKIGKSENNGSWIYDLEKNQHKNQLIFKHHGNINRNRIEASLDN